MSSDFERMLRGGSLLTAEILYCRPDHPSLLQSFSWQTIDVAPLFPRLAAFLEHWRTEVQAMIHSVRVAHADWTGPSMFRSVNHLIQLH
jgi:uncharacterized protein Usg